MNEWWSPIIIVGAIIIFFLIRRATVKKKSADFDERQEQIRGRAYKLSFLGTAISMIAGIIYTSIYENILYTPFLMTLCICVGVGIFAVYSIANDSYMGLRGDTSYRLIIFILVGAVNILVGLYKIISGNLTGEGALGICMINLSVGILFAVITFAMIIKVIINKKRSE